MRISRVAIRNYRSIRSLEVEVDDYTALIGANGSGKSSIPYALDWFFNGGLLTRDDVHLGAGRSAAPTGDDARIVVEVTFSDLNYEDRGLLGRHGRGEVARLCRIWDASTDSERFVGDAHQGPGFAAVRCSPDAATMKERYQSLRAEQPTLGLPPAGTKKAIEAGLDAWEHVASNAGRLVTVPESDAGHLLAAQDEQRLARRIAYVLIPAATDMAQQVGVMARDSALRRLVGGLLGPAVEQARDAWLARHRTVLDELTESVTAGVGLATDQHVGRINERLAELLPRTTVEIAPSMPDWRPTADPTLRTNVVIDGARHDVSRQGHGVQRAVMMAMLQALAPQAAREGTDEDAIAADPGPALVIAIEEPELYQHPVRARHFARSLTRLSQSEGTQVCLATHSPYFVRPEQFAGLRRLTLEHGCSRLTSTSIIELAAVSELDEARVQKRLELELPNAFSEGFFADLALLVEGDTDRVVFETLAEGLGTPLDAVGIAVLAVGGKENLRLAVELLERLGTPTFVAVDGDAFGADRKHPRNPDKRAKARASHEEATERMLSWLVPRGTTELHGRVPRSFGAATAVTDAYLYLQDDLEHELEQWPAYVAWRKRSGVASRAKDVSAYRAAVIAAGASTAPEVLHAAVEAMIGRRERSAVVHAQGDVARGTPNGHGLESSRGTGHASRSG